LSRKSTEAHRVFWSVTVP